MRIVQAAWGVFHHFDLARELEQRGHLQRIFSTFPWARLKREGVTRSRVRTFPWVHMPYFLAGRYLPWASESINYANAVLFDAWLDRRLRQEEFDAFISLSGVGLASGRHVRQRGIPFICDRGSTHQRYQERLVADEFRRWGVEWRLSKTLQSLHQRELDMYEAADLITVLSSFAARSFVESGIPESKIRVIPLGVRLDKFHPVGEPPPEALEVLYVGQVGLRKGIPYLLQAFADLRHPRKRLRVVGAVQDHIRDVLRRLPQEQVLFLGKQPQAEVARYMSTSHVLVLPSVEDGFGLVLGQALACGCPVIATTNTGGTDLFSDGVEGFIVPIRDPAALRDRMQEIADDPRLRQRMSEAALRRVRGLGGWHQYGDRWVSLLESMLNRTRI